MVYDRWSVFLEQVKHTVSIGKITANTGKRAVFLQQCPARFLQSNVIVIIEVIKPENCIAIIQQPSAKMKADKTSGASDKNCFVHDYDDPAAALPMFGNRYLGRGYLARITYKYKRSCKNPIKATYRNQFLVSKEDLVNKKTHTLFSIG